MKDLISPYFTRFYGDLGGLPGPADHKPGRGTSFKEPILACASKLVPDDQQDNGFAWALAELFCDWSQADARRVYKLTQATSALIRATRIDFMPERPTATFSNRSLILEAAGGQLLPGVTAVSARHVPFISHAMQPGYEFIVIGPNLVKVFYMIQAGDKLAAMANYGHDAVEAAKRDDLEFAVASFAFSASFWALRTDLEYVKESESSGPGAFEVRGGKRRRSGSLWTYVQISADLRKAGLVADGQAAPTGGEDLVLMPTMVRPHFRRLPEGKVILVGAHESSRWRNPEKIGSKVVI